MGFYFRVAPGVRVRVNSRGVRTSVGPRAARVHVGAGRTGFSTGAGPVTYYTSLSSSRPQQRRTAGGTRSSTQHAPSAAAQAKAAQAARLANAFDEIYSLNDCDFPDAGQPLAPPPMPIDIKPFRTARRRDARSSTSIFKPSDRRAALQAADAAAIRDADAAHVAAVQQMYAHQTELDAWWAAMKDCDPDTVMGALATAFEDNAARAAIAGIHGTEASLVVVVPGVDAVPDRRSTLTAAGNLSLKKLTKTETGQAYKALVVGHVLLTVREAFAVAPALGTARIVAVRMSARAAPEPLLAAGFSRARLAGVDWTHSATGVLDDFADDVLITEKGVTREIQVLDLTTEPELRSALSLVSAESDGHTDEPASA